MVAAYGHQYFFFVEAPLAYAPPQLGSHAIRVGLYNDELVAAPNPRVGEDGVEVVLDAAVDSRLGVDAAEDAVASSGPAVDPVEKVVCASLSPTCCRGVVLTACTRSSRKRIYDEVDDGCAGRRCQPRNHRGGLVWPGFVYARRLCRCGRIERRCRLRSACSGVEAGLGADGGAAGGEVGAMTAAGPIEVGSPSITAVGAAVAEVGVDGSDGIRGGGGSSSNGTAGCGTGIDMACCK
jgi:hypothetical protein